MFAGGDPGRKVRFAKDLYQIALKQESRWKPTRTCATWPKYDPPDPEEPDHKKYVQFREWVARKKAWSIACSANNRREKFNDMDEDFFFTDPALPKILYASDRNFIIDSGASYHLIGLNKLTEEEKTTIRSVKEPFHIQSANGTLTITEEAHVRVPALNIWIWAQLVEECPAVLSLGILCGKQGWSYEWKSGGQPTMSKGSKSITLTPHHDVPMIFTSQSDKEQEPKSEESTRDNSWQERSCPPDCGGRPSAEAENEVLSSPSSSQESSTTASTSSSSSSSEASQKPKKKVKKKACERKKQRFVKSKYAKAPSARHNLYTHFPADPDCEICKMTKITKAPCKAGAIPEPDGLPPARKFGDRLTADHKTLIGDQASRGGARYALIIQDEYTRWIQAFATKTRSYPEVMQAFRRFMPMDQQPKHVYLDNAPELIKAMEELTWTFDTGTPHRPETNGAAERAVRRVKEGTSATLLQSGLPEDWWQEAMDCYCFLRCVHDQLNAGSDSSSTAFELRFGHQFKGPIIPFGAQIEYKPSQQSDIFRLHQFGKKMLPGIFMGYVQHAGGGWTGDLLVSDWEQIENAKRTSDIHVKRFKAEEVVIIIKQNQYCFPITTGNLRVPGETNKQLIRRVSSSTQNKNKEQLPGAIHGEPEAADAEEAEEARSSPSSHIDEPHHQVAPEDYWTMKGDLLVRHHLQPRKELFVPEESNMPFPLKYIDIIRSTRTTLESPSEKSFDDYWNVPYRDSEGNDPKPSNRELSEYWTGQTTFTLLRPPPPEGREWVLGRLTKKQKSLRPPTIWPEIWCSLSPKQKEQARAEWAKEKPKLEEAQAARGFKYVSEDDEDYARLIDEARVRLAPHEAPAMPCIAYGCYAGGDPDFIAGGDPGSIAGGDPSFIARGEKKRRRKHQDHTAPKGYASVDLFALVHTPIPIGKAMRIPEAKKAIDEEWHSQENKTTWNTKKVRPKAEVIAEAERMKVSVHFGKLMDLCHLKHAELAPELQKYKGRVVFRGDQVKDETGLSAVFTEQGASASQMAAAKFLDTIARMQGMSGQAADGIKAYTQVQLSLASELLGLPKNECPETWISLPPSRQPASWKNIKDPVCPLERNLYGHPLAGLLWEKYLEAALRKIRWEKIPGWECLYVHRQKRLFLSVYVDDFKMVGKRENITDMWNRIRKEIDLDPETELIENVYLGCNQKEVQPDLQCLNSKNELFKKLTTYAIAEGVLCEADLKQETPQAGSMILAGGDPSSSRRSYPKTDVSKTRAWNYDMIGHAEKCVERWCELANKEPKDLPMVGTPCIDDHNLRPEDFIEKGELSQVCQKIVMKCLYLARIGRPDILYAINVLARCMTKWTRACDKRLERLIAYIHKTNNHVQHCFVGDKAEDCKLGLFCDASFAADLKDSKSTTGALMCVFGPSTFVPITWVCKKQGAVSHSSTEAEVIALDAALRLEGLSALMLWDIVIEVLRPEKNHQNKKSLALGDQSQKQPTQGLMRLSQDSSGMVRPQSSVELLVREIDFVPPSAPLSSGLARLFMFEDNEAVIKICLKGRSPTLRHISRTHRVDLDWLIERIKTDPGIQMKYVGTNEQMADMLTKASFTVQKWQNMLKMHQIGESGTPCPSSFPRKGCIKKKKNGSVVLAQHEEEILDSACSLDFAPRCLCAMPAPASSSSTVKGPKPPSSPPPGFEKEPAKAKSPQPPPGPPPPGFGLLLQKIPEKTTAELEAELPDFELPDWTDDADPAESDLSQEVNNVNELIYQMEVNMTTRKYSFTRRSYVHHCAESSDNPKKTLHRLRQRDNRELTGTAKKLYIASNRYDQTMSSEELATLQWSNIFYDIFHDVGVHNEKLSEMAFGILNEDKTSKSVEELSKVAISLVKELIAQGDLCFDDSNMEEHSQLAALINKPEYLQTPPFAEVHNIDMFESEILFFSDSVTKLGKKAPASRFEKYHNENLSYAGIREETIHGAPFKINWNCESGCTGAKMVNKVRSIIDTFYDSQPKNFKGRIVIFGCLNDLQKYPKSRDEPLPRTYEHEAEKIRDYLSQFEIGRVIWLGPGTEKIWNYNGRNIIWDPWANEFMRIISGSGIPIFQGRHALSNRELQKGGQNEHLANNHTNIAMLVGFIHSSLRLSSFLGMIKGNRTPDINKEGDDQSPFSSESEPEVQPEDDQNSTEKEEESVKIDRDPKEVDKDPMNLERLCLSPKKGPTPPSPWAPVESLRPASSSATGDGSGAETKKEKSSDPQEDDRHRHYSSSGPSASTTKTPDKATGSKNLVIEIPDDTEIPKKEKAPIDRSDATKAAGSSKRKRITRSKCILTPVANGSKVTLKPAPRTPYVPVQGPIGAPSNTVRELDELDEMHRTQKDIKHNEFTYDIFVSLKKQLKSHGGPKQLSFEDTIEKICVMARFPFTIKPGDWLMSRPRSINERKPPPRCREILWDHLEPRVAKENEKPGDLWRKKTSTLIATLPYNYLLGPVRRVSFQCEDGIWQLMVQLNSICANRVGGELLVWVTISSGTTQWARWHVHTGDPSSPEGLPPPIPDPDPSYTRVSIGPAQTTERLLQDGPDGLEKWQQDIPLKRIIRKEDRVWTWLPCGSGSGTYEQWLLQFAMETLRHENRHDPYDGSMSFLNFYKEMTRKAWNYSPDKCKFVCRNPMRLLQTLIWATNSLTFYACWYLAPPTPDELLYVQPSEATHGQWIKIIPLYIRSIQGHSGLPRSFVVRGQTEWDIRTKHTTHVYHYGKRENLDSIMRCGLLPGGLVRERRSHSYFSIKNPLEDAPSCHGGCTQRPVHFRLKHPINEITLITWPLEEENNAIYYIEVQRCQELGIILRQNLTGAILSEVAIPPECISKVIDLNQNILFLNDELDKTAPGERKAKHEIGAPIQQASLFVTLRNGMKEWPKEIVEKEAAVMERKYYLSYDRNFNDEQMCAECKQFCFKGIKHCSKCRKNPAEQR